MIKTILVVLTIVFFLILTVPAQLILSLIGKNHPKAKEKYSLKMVQWVFRLILRLSGTDITIIGRDNIPDDTPVLYVGNHRSYFDVVIGYTQVKGLCGFIAKKEMERYPLLSGRMRDLNCLFLDRKNVREGLKTILAGIDLINSGRSIWIFPEGTRGNEENMLPFHEGSMKIAVKSGCPIIPVAISNSANIFENHIPFIRKAHVTMEFGTPIYPQELSVDIKKALGTYTQGKIQEMLEHHA